PGGLHDLLGVQQDASGLMMTKAVSVKQAATVFPSYTYPAWTSLFTGVFPGTHGITGNSLFFRRREVARYYAEFHIDAVKVQLEKDFLGGDISDQVKTLYEYVDQGGGQSLVVHHMIMRGSGKGARPADFDTLWNYQRNRSHAVDENALWEAVKSLKDFNGDVRPNAPLQLPTVMTIYFSGLDHAEHLSPETPEMARLEYLKQLDDLIAKFMAGDSQISRTHFDTPASEPGMADTMSWRGLQGEQVMERTLFVLVSDHGHTQTKWTDALGIEDLKVIFDELSAKSERTYTLETPTFVIEESWFSKVRALFGFLHNGSISPRTNVIAALNGGALGLYVKPYEGQWKDNPVYDRDIVPILHHLLLTLHKNGQGPEAVLYKDGTRYMFVPYHYDGTTIDLLPAVNLEESPLNAAEYPMAQRRLNGLASRVSTGPQSAPDVVLLADRHKGLTYSNKQDWRVVEPLNVEKHRHFHSDHGHLNASDSLVPIIFWVGGYEGRDPLGTICEASIVDVTPTILDALGLLPLFDITMQPYLEETKGTSLKPLLDVILNHAASPVANDVRLCPARIEKRPDGLAAGRR
ncbi:MAG: alkaline phosphatase family protein, partial [Nitrospirales bacterium]|nr:alkaline phosphatase family protein [Nitrospirales bacterium]